MVVVTDSRRHFCFKRFTLLQCWVTLSKLSAFENKILILCPLPCNDDYDFELHVNLRAEKPLNVNDSDSFLCYTKAVHAVLDLRAFEV